MQSSKKWLAFLALLVASQAYGKDNLCFSGECTADTHDYSMTIRGPKDLIGDLTEEGGWRLFNCDPRVAEQTISAICKDSALCKHLHDGGETGKIVRLPAECSVEGFARIAKFSAQNNADVPPDIRQHINADVDDKAYSVTFDTKFDQVPQRSDPITFAFTSATGNADQGELNRRAYFPGIYSGATEKLYSAKIKDKPVVDTPTIDKKYSFPLTKDVKDFDILGAKAKCANSNVSSASTPFSVKASAKLDMKFAGGLTIIGSIVPPKVSKFQMYGKLTGTVVGKIALSGGASGTLDSGEFILLDIPFVIPGIPNILSVGPKFQLAVRAEGTLDASLEHEIGFGYEVKDMRMFFPEGDGENMNSGSIEPVETNQALKLAHGKAELKLAVHVMPRLSIGITVPAGKADLFAEIDFSGVAGLELEKDALKLDKKLPEDAENNKNNLKRATRLDIAARHTSNMSKRWFWSKEDAFADLGIKGCAYVRFDVAANVGASAKFFQIFELNPDTKYALFKSSYELFKKCSDEARHAELKIPAPERTVVSAKFEDEVAMEYDVVNSRRRSLPSLSSLERRGSSLSCKRVMPTMLESVFNTVARATKLVTQ